MANKAWRRRQAAKLAKEKEKENSESAAKKLTEEKEPKPKAKKKSNSKVKRVWMRALWGINPDPQEPATRVIKRKYAIDKEMVRMKANSFNEPFVVYVFGEENYKNAVEMGYECVLLDKNPHPWNLQKQQYRHKLETLRYAFEEDGYDEVVHFDWDCIPQKKLPIDIWEQFGQKEAIQSNLQLYRRGKCSWRDGFAKRLVPNGGFMYLRDKTIPAKLIKIWEDQGSGFSAEPPIGQFVDNELNGWRGKEVYWHLYEPMFCNLHKASAYSAELLALKDMCFKHYQG